MVSVEIINYRYRFGFNGMEAENEIYNNGGYDFGARIYDGRSGRWLSRDPLENNYPSFSTYSGFLNNPIFIIDPTGKGGKSSLININGEKKILVTTTLIIYTHNEDIQKDIHSYASEIKKEAQGYFNVGAKSSWAGLGEYEVVFSVNVQVYQDGQKIEHRPDVNYVELVDDPGGSGGLADPDHIKMNVSSSRSKGNYAHEVGHSRIWENVFKATRRPIQRSGI